MSPPPRRLTFAVGTGLLSALSLTVSATGCDEGDSTANPAPVQDKKQPEPEVTANPGPEPQPEPAPEPTPEVAPEDVEPDRVNTGPEPLPEGEDGPSLKERDPPVQINTLPPREPEPPPEPPKKVNPGPVKDKPQAP